jgi:hypothetical protein
VNINDFELYSLYIADAEMTIFQRIGCDCVSVASPSLLFAARTSGIDVHVISLPETKDDSAYSELVERVVRGVFENEKGVGW